MWGPYFENQYGVAWDSRCCWVHTFQPRGVRGSNYEKPVHRGGCKIEGGFGPVYKGILKYTEVAIKLLNTAAIRKDKKGQELFAQQFDTELRVLTKYHHPNLVVLLGYYNSPSLKALVYEYLPNGTLEDALETGLEGRSKEGKAKISGIHLPWMCRISIATDTARGLAYLHTADTVPLVHRDVKSANVLLDLAFRAKVGDFGLARVFQESDSTSTSRVVGTSGYIPPEYYHGRITTKMDTYSFGVILLSGLPSYNSQRSHTSHVPLPLPLPCATPTPRSRTWSRTWIKDRCITNWRHS
eukprot:Em0009g50a